MSKKKYLAIYLGSEAALEKAGWSNISEEARKELEQKGVEAWQAWATKHAQAIVDDGTPIGKTKRVGRAGISNVKNAITAYTIVEADSHEAAAKLFEDHPHFTIFPGEGVEVMECLDLAEMIEKAKR